MKPPNTEMESIYPAYVGPYKIGKTLGQGQTGIVKLGVHCKTREKAAIKIINKQKLKTSVLQKVEREIAIMRLIEHPHILGLYDVYESSRYLYLVLEHVSGGELFDYLVKKGRLSPKEACHFFRQIISAVDFCHRYGVCHRDLKPENLLLDDNKNLKVADFGMASLQLENSLLETSCGSPHYACPEVIKGGPYNGKQADVWSSGIILYALLVGSLPFDHQDMSKLLERVRTGKYSMPTWMPAEARSLIQQMLQVSPDKRITLQNVFKHPFLLQHKELKESTYLRPIETVLYTQPLNHKDDLDNDIVKQMSSLGCFKSCDDLTQNLIDSRHNMEKVVYFLLLDRKRRQPALKDSIPLRKRWKNRASSRETPHKRVDSVKLDTCEPAAPVSPQISGSLCKAASAGEPSTSPPPETYVSDTRRYSLGTRLDSITEADTSSSWRRIFSTFSSSSSSHRSLERLTSPNMTSRESCVTSRESCVTSRESCYASSRDSCSASRDKLASGKRALSLSVGNNLPTHSGLVAAHSPERGEREEETRTVKSLLPWKQKNKETFVVLRGTTLNQFNIDFVQIVQKFKISHSIVDWGYLCKYNSSKKGLLSKSVKFYVTADERPANSQGNDTVICVSIQYKSGSTKKFKRLCEKIQLALFRPTNNRPFSPILRKVCSYLSESDGKMTSDTDSHGSFDMLSSNCSDPSF
ncbi:serine/threonine kinase SAD-1-like isoform X2 [Bolinopsis microptera]|uniref:serine/threonine kinase SAD-1-like isoform X2 n=1 Tax=Bolinopsis microptera TaxID=2820187 RepID=UPI00307A2E73